MVKTILLKKNGEFDLPEGTPITKTKRTLKIKFPYCMRYDRLCKDNFQITSQSWFRTEGKDKPYIPEGFIEIDGILYEIKKEEEDE